MSLLAFFDAEPRTPSAEDVPLTEEYLREQEREYLIKRLNRYLNQSADEFNDMTLEDLQQVYLHSAKAEGLLAAEVTETQLRQVLRITMLNKYATRRYQLKPYPGRITLFRNENRPGWDHDYGWSAFALGGVDVQLSAGTHVDFVLGANAHTVAAQLSSYLAEADQSDRPDAQENCPLDQPSEPEPKLVP